MITIAEEHKKLAFSLFGCNDHSTIRRSNRRGKMVSKTDEGCRVEEVQGKKRNENKNRKMALIDNFVFLCSAPKKQNRHLTYPQAINHHIYKTIRSPAPESACDHKGIFK